MSIGTCVREEDGTLDRALMNTKNTEGKNAVFLQFELHS